jgi:hypothetical protein
MNDELKNNSTLIIQHSALTIGFTYSSDEQDTSLSGSVTAGVVYDDSEKANIETLLGGLAETDFVKGAEL